MMFCTYSGRFLCPVLGNPVQKLGNPVRVKLRGLTTLIGKREKSTKKELISNLWLNFLYTVQLVISDVCTKFQNSRSSSS